MARPIISVSKASDEHAGELSALWIESALSSGMSHELAARVANAALPRNARPGDGVKALARAWTTVLQARSDGSLVGFAVVNTRNHGLLEPAALAIDELYVAAAARRQGVGSHVLAAVARVAESEGHELVFANVAATDKLSNRYFARLGFGASVTRRVVPTGVLRRKLAGADPARDMLLGRRRTIRARARVAAPSVPAPARSLTLRRSAAS